MEENYKRYLSTDYAMVGGDGPLSYTKNSFLQRDVAESAKLLIQEGVAKKLDINNFSGNTFCIADLGCSTGPNTFLAIQNIIESVELKYRNQGSSDTEFHIIFNDNISNDFNTLFRSLPIDKKYYASGVPGSFHNRLFPRASLNLVYSSNALNWLSKLPEEIMDRNSPAWNKGRIHVANAKKEVIETYSNEYAREMNLFLNARHQEVVPGGLMMIIIPARPDDVPHSQLQIYMLNEALGSSLMDLAKMGKIDEADVDSFNIPVHLVSPNELKEIVNKNGKFTIESLENLPQPKVTYSSATVLDLSACMRAAIGGLISEKFGHQIINELFELYVKKLKDGPHLRLGKELNLFVLLKRKLHD